MADQTRASHGIARRVARSTIINVVGKVVAAALGFALTPFLLHRLGAEAFGWWVLAGSAVGYTALLEFGIGSAVSKYVAECNARNETEKAGRLITTALGLHIALGIAAFATSAALSTVLPGLFHIPAAQRADFSRFVLLLGAGVGVSIPATITTSILRGMQRFDLVNLLSIAGAFASAAVSVGVVVSGGGIAELATASIFLILGMQVPSLTLIRRIAPSFVPGILPPDRTSIRMVLSFSWPLWIMNLSGAIQTRTDEMVIGALLPVSFVAPYAIARKLATSPQIVTDQFVKVLMPLAAEIHAVDEAERVREVYLLGSKIALMILVPLTCFLCMFAGPILVAWVGSGYSPYATTAVILTLAVLFDTSQWAAGLVLQGIGRHRVLAGVAAVDAAANLGLSLALAGPMGINGVAIGTLAPKIVTTLLFLWPYSMRVMQVTIHRIVSDVLVPAVAPAVPALAALYLWRLLLNPASLLHLALAAAACVSVYLSTWILFWSQPTESRFILDGVASALQRLNGRPRAQGIPV